MKNPINKKMKSNPGDLWGPTSSEKRGPRKARLNRDPGESSLLDECDVVSGTRTGALLNLGV